MPNFELESFSSTNGNAISPTSHHSALSHTPLSRCTDAYVHRTFHLFSPALMAAAPRTPPPPPLIGKAGNFTVFVTPPPTPTPSDGLRTRIEIPAPAFTVDSPRKEAPLPAKVPPPVVAPPPVQVPPLQFETTATKPHGSVFGFFWDAIVRVQDAHSSLDEYLADWLRLDHSKYQWALNDYYETIGKMKESDKVSKPKGLVNKRQAV